MPRSSCYAFESFWSALVASDAPLEVVLTEDLRLTNVCLEESLKEWARGTRTCVSIFTHQDNPDRDTAIQGSPDNFAVLIPYAKEQAKVNVLLCRGRTYDLYCSGRNSVRIIGYFERSLRDQEAVLTPPLPATTAVADPDSRTNESDWVTCSDINLGSQNEEMVTKRPSEGWDLASDVESQPMRRPRQLKEVIMESSMHSSRTRTTESTYSRKSPERPSAVGLVPTFKIPKQVARATDSPVSVETRTLERGRQGRRAVKGTVIIAYYVLFVDGVQIASAQEEPVHITVGKNDIIPGIDDVFLGVEIGEMRRISIPTIHIPASLNLTAKSNMTLDIQVLSMM
ncbi:hypothetical protein FB107DRAFT_279869 [Schizophyllum commune]